MYKNPLKTKLENKVPVAGIIVQGAMPALVEICGLAGFDFIFIDAEHGPLSERDCEDMVRAAEVRDTVPIIRVPRNSPETILRFMDIGAMGVIIPGVSSKEDAEAAVRAVKFYPMGNRGLTSPRTADYGMVKPLPEYVTEANRETLVFALIENPEGIEHLEDILAVQGMDGAIFGAGDFSQAVGFPGQWHHPKVLDAFEQFVAVGTRSGKGLGTVLRPGETIKQHVDRGITVLITAAYPLFAAQAKSWVASVRAERK